MIKKNQQEILVYAHWMGVNVPTLMGLLHATPSRGKEVFSFAYDREWLAHHSNLLLDPSLQLFHGPQYAREGQPNFGIFLDSSPDRWGRVLMDRREAQLAREEKRKERRLLESDYLLGVYDEHRIGALRFRTDPNGPFLNNEKRFASPPWTSLRELEHACLELEKEGSESKAGYAKWLQMLIAPGGSLGGARPKASVVDAQKHLWIAKFPSALDDNDIGAWEMLAYHIARRAKVSMSESKVQKFKSKHHTFLSKRFDRTPSGERIHFASALTLLQRSDGDDASKGASYLELADLIKRLGASPSEDLEQLWRRIVFFICISNTDDHLRNHGFLLRSDGWQLSPAFDVNPVSLGHGLKLNISETDNSQDLDLAKSVSRYFRLNEVRTNEIIREVIKAVQSWREIADSLGLSMRSQDRMASAFRVAETAHHFTLSGEVVEKSG